MFDYNFYLERGKKNYELREEAENLADQLIEKEIKNIFFVGSGGSIAMLASFIDYFKKLSDIPVYGETSAEFCEANYRQLTNKSLVFLVSKTGDADEAVKAAKYCKENDITCIAFVGVKDSPVYNLASHKIYIDEDISAFRYIQVYFVAFRLLYKLSYFDSYSKFASELELLPEALIDAAQQFEKESLQFVETHHNDKFQLWIGSGANMGELNRYATCVSEEIFRIKTQAIHSAEFFHGAFEIVDGKTPVILIKGEDESRKIDKRVEKFLNRYAPNAKIIDLKDFQLTGISNEYRKYFGPVLLSMLLGDRIKKNMMKKTGLNYKTRNYYRVVNY